MAEKFDEFLEEVENDIRKEKMLQLWKQYGKQVVAGVVGIIILISGYNFWSYYEQNKRTQMAEKLIAAQDFIGQGETEKAQTILSSLASGSPTVYQPLALFQKAGLLLQLSQKPEEAREIYQQLAANTKIDPLWRNLATLLSVMVSIDQPNSKIDDLLTQLSTLTTNQNPWRYLANEFKGVLLHRKGDHTQAAELFAKLVQDSQTPSGISMRARLMVQIVSADITE
ncbi:MAG: tetratricopeptide repeat protein [Candidatus Paracaedibacter sp.]